MNTHIARSHSLLFTGLILFLAASLTPVLTHAQTRVGLDFALAPGRYAWIAEMPNPAEKGMLQPFTVPSE